MELRQLRYFCAVGEEEHFGRAAARLRIAQPALTRQIQQLEHELGVELFERLPRGVRLTEVGRALLADAKRVLAEVEDLAERVRAAGKGETGKLRVGVAESSSSRNTMVNSIIRFRALYPQVVLELQHMTSLNQLDAITNRYLDAAFVYHFPEERSDLMHIPVEETRILLAAPQEHRLARAEEVRLSDIGSEPMVWIRRAAAPATYDTMMRACLQAGVSPNIVQEGTSEPMQLSLVSVGGLLAFVTDTNRERCPGNVVLRPVVDLHVVLTLQLCWRESDRSPALRRFVSTVAQTKAAEGAPAQVREYS